MTWVKLDDSFPFHPKIARLNDAQFRFYVTALCHCCQHLTDGVIIVEALPRTHHSVLSSLVAAGLFEKDGEVLKIHDFLEFQPSRAAVLEGRKKKAEAGAIGGRNKVANAKQSAKQTASTVSSTVSSTLVGKVSTPVPSPSPSPPSLTGNGEPTSEDVPASKTTRDARASDPAFEIFWNSFPRLRRLEKPKAVRAWKALSPEGRALATDGVIRLRDAYANAPPDRIKFIPYPERWLKNHRWEDPPEEVARQAAPERPPGTNGPPPRVPGAPSRPPGVTFAPDGSWLTLKGERFDREYNFEKRGIAGWYRSAPNGLGEGGGVRLDGSGSMSDAKWTPAEYVDFFRRHGIPGLPEKLLAAIGCFPSAMKEPAEQATESKPVKAGA